MAYTGKKPIDFVDVTESQTFKVTESLDVQGNELVLDADGDTSITSDTDDQIDFKTGGSDRVTIDSSGNVLVATTDTTPYNNTTGGGFVVASSGLTSIARETTSANQAILHLNNTGVNGTVAEFAKDGTTSGVIGTNASDIWIASGNVGLLFWGGGAVSPKTSAGADTDNTIDLGISNVRFNDAYITNGVTTGSDQNEKQQIASLTDAEIAAAKRISNGFKTFKWNDAVTAKGDNARTHTGVIAQEVRTALEAEGLDAGDYAFFMSNTWWEADEAYTDDDGNAQTRTVAYHTQADAPDGATERTRLGIRYPELLAFIGAATEQRLADIETRLTALEATD